MVPNDRCDLSVVLDVGKDALANHCVLLHLDPLLDTQWSRLLEQTIRETDLADVMNEAGKVSETLLSFT